MQAKKNAKEEIIVSLVSPQVEYKIKELTRLTALNIWKL